MFQIDKSQFGAFIAGLRRERGLTQRDLAARLCLSDKAVSKWETGKSLPDIALLPALAEELGVTATELLACRRMEGGEALAPAETDELLRRAVELVPPEKRGRPSGRLTAALLAVLALTGLELWLLLDPLDWRPEPVYLWLPVGMAAGSGVYFFLFARTRLPRYYDENRINCYTDGLVRIHLPGVRFDNATWPRMLTGFRIWCAAAVLTWPPLCYALDRLTAPGSPLRLAVMLLFVFTVFLPAYLPGLKRPR